MNIIIEKEIVFEELNLLPIWLHKNRQQKINSSLLSIGSYFFKNLNVSIVVSDLDKLPADEKELFKNVHIYMNSISENSKYYRNIKEGELDGPLYLSSNHHIFLIGATNSKNLTDLSINFKKLPSLEEMLANPDKKKKLWHDIQSLLNDEVRENN